MTHKIVLEYRDNDEYEIVNTQFIRDRAPFLLHSEEIENHKKTSIKNFSKCLPFVNPELIDTLTFEHCGYPVDKNHNQYVNENEETTINVVLLKNFHNNSMKQQWWCTIKQADCVLFKENEDQIFTSLLRTSIACYPEPNIQQELLTVDINDDCKHLELHEDCVVISNPWPDGFQHSLQDIVPRIVAIKDWLSKNRNVVIVCYPNLDILWWLNTYFPEIKNNILLTKSDWVTSTKKLYTVVQNPSHRCEMVPFGLYTNMNIIAPKTCGNKYLVIFDRFGCDFRNINSQEIINVLNETNFLEKNGLELLIINPTDYDRGKLIKILHNTMGVIAAHGGANYNVLFMRRELYRIDKQRFFIEFVTQECMHHLYHIALGARLKYYPIICEGSNHYKKEMAFKKDDLRRSLELLNE